MPRPSTSTSRLMLLPRPTDTRPSVLDGDPPFDDGSERGPNGRNRRSTSRRQRWPGMRSAALIACSVAACVTNGRPRVAHDVHGAVIAAASPVRSGYSRAIAELRTAVVMPVATQRGGDDPRHALGHPGPDLRYLVVFLEDGPLQDVARALAPTPRRSAPVARDLRRVGGIARRLRRVISDWNADVAVSWMPKAHLRHGTAVRGDLARRRCGSNTEHRHLPTRWTG